MLRTLSRILRTIDNAIEWAEGIEKMQRECHHARGFRFRFSEGTFSISGDKMTFTMLSNLQVQVKADLRVASGALSPATLSGLILASSDPTVFTVEPDPASPTHQGIITGVGPGTAKLLASGTATESDIGAHPVSDSADIVLTAVQASNPAVGFTFTFGTPTVAPPPPPPPPIKP